MNKKQSPERLEYLRNYRKTHKEQYRKYQQKYYQSHKDYYKNYSTKYARQEISRLNNIINEYKNDIRTLINVWWKNDTETTTEENEVCEKWYFQFKEDKLKELKEENK